MNDNKFSITDEPPQAHHVEVVLCGHCSHPHLLLFDENNQLMAQAVLPDNTILALTQARFDALKGSEHGPHS